MKTNRKRLLVISVLLLLIGAMLLTVLACEPGFNVVVVNGTDQVLTIYLAEGKKESPVRQGKLMPGEHLKTPGLWVITNYYRILAKNDKDETVYSREFDYDELRDAKFEVVIKTPQSK